MPKSKTIANFSLGTWNVRGFRRKVGDIEGILKRKGVDICAIQETKTEKILEPEDAYSRFLWKTTNKALGLGFLVRKGLTVINEAKISDRIAYIIVKKKEKFKAKITPRGVKIFRIRKKQSNIVYINVHAPHMGVTKSKPEESEAFYNELSKLVVKFKGMDLVILGDFNAKLGKIREKDEAVGAHARGRRNDNGESLYNFLVKENFVATNTVFKHKACHITTFEQKRKKVTIFNQIDYILVRFNRKKSLIDARSYINNGIDTDHRLVISRMYQKIDFERGKSAKERKIPEDQVLSDLKQKKKVLREKIFQSTNAKNIRKWKSERNQVCKAIQKRNAELLVQQLEKEASEINNLKGNAKAAVALNKLLKPKTAKIKSRMPPLEKLTQHYSSIFNNKSHNSDIPLLGANFIPISIGEVRRNKNRLRNDRAAGPDGAKSEDIKKMSDFAISEELNRMIEEKDPILTHGYIVPILKPGKSSTEPSSYRPIILMSVWRKLLSLIILKRIEKDLEIAMDKSQHAYSKNKSTGDVVLAHKILQAASIERDFNPVIVGIDMSKAFDTVNRSMLLSLLTDVISESDLHIINILMSGTTLALKVGKRIGKSFKTNIGVPQGDALSPKLFTFYLDVALKRVERLNNANCDHSYHAPQEKPFPSYMAYADDVDFIIFKEKIGVEDKLEHIEKIFSEFGLILNKDKTEITNFGAKCDLSNVKKLGSILDDASDVQRRDQLSQIALRKYEKVWKNKFIKNSKKIDIYNTFVKPIFTYNSSTWLSNKGFDEKVDIVQRKHLRRVLNIHYPRIITNENLYSTCRTQKLSLVLAERRKSHLGHVLRRDSVVKDILKYIESIPYRRNCRQKPASILKTYRQFVGTDILSVLEEKAIARTL